MLLLGTRLVNVAVRRKEMEHGTQNRENAFCKATIVHDVK